VRGGLCPGAAAPAFNGIAGPYHKPRNGPHLIISITPSLNRNQQGQQRPRHWPASSHAGEAGLSSRTWPWQRPPGLVEAGAGPAWTRRGGRRTTRRRRVAHEPGRPRLANARCDGALSGGSDNAIGSRWPHGLGSSGHASGPASLNA
jgi:hypothetical protein